MVAFKCVHCGINMEAPESKSGLAHACPICGRPVLVPPAPPPGIAPAEDSGILRAQPIEGMVFIAKLAVWLVFGIVLLVVFAWTKDAPPAPFSKATLLVLTFLTAMITGHVLHGRKR